MNSKPSSPPARQPNCVRLAHFAHFVHFVHFARLALCATFLLHPACRRAASHEAAPGGKPLASTDGIATWYEVPDGSLPERRAPGQMTAASDKLPPGTTARVINLSNGKAVIVHITDDGLHGASDIDLCKEAALQLGIVKKGVTKVRVERLAAEPEK